MARNPHALAEVTSTELPVEQAEQESNGKKQRDIGPKVVYIQLAAGTDKSAILSVHTNTRTLVDAMEQTPGSSYTKLTLPQGEPRGKRGGAG